MTPNSSWPTRLRRTAIALHVVGFVAGLVAVIVDGGFESGDGAAILLAALGVSLTPIVDVPMSDEDMNSRLRSWMGLVVGTVLYLIAIGLSGGVTSSFVVLPLASIFHAAVSGGIRVAGPMTIVAVVGVAIVSADDVGANSDVFIQLTAIYLITAVALSEVQRALLSETARADDLAFTPDAVALRRARLEETHGLLANLLDVAMSPELNAVAAAQDAVRDIGSLLPDASVRVETLDGLTLARRGDPQEERSPTVIEIHSAGAPCGSLLLWTGQSLTADERSGIEEGIEAIGIALENDAMVQRLAGVAIQRERVRLARELHDDITPTIASVGLALDMVLLGEGVAPEQRLTLEATRSNVTRLVDQIRNRVQDLRADRSVSIVELAGRLVAEVDTDGPTVSIDIEERTPPRPAVAVEVGALVTEAFRNAVSHANAGQITIRGKISTDAGTITVLDDGDGFDPADLSDRRFGLIGMKERASLVGAELTIESELGSGSRVVVEWSENT